MKVFKLIVVWAVILVTAGEKLGYCQNPRSTLNIRLKRQTPKEIDAPQKIIKPVRTKKPGINLDKLLNVQPSVPGHQVKVIPMKNPNAQNVISKRPIIIINNLKSPKKHSNKLTVDNNIKNNLHNDVNKVEYKEKEHNNVKTDTQEAKVETTTPKVDFEGKEIENHVSVKPDKESPKATLNDKATKSNEEIIPNESKHPVPDIYTKSIEPQEPQINSDTNKSQDHEEKPVTQKEDKVRDEILKKNEIIETIEKPEAPNIQIAGLVHSSPDQDTNENFETKTNASEIPIKTLDKSLELEGGEEIIIQNNNYEELYETQPRYDTPKLIQSELRTPFWDDSINNKDTEQYIFDDKLDNYNQYVDNTYNGLRNKYIQNPRNYYWNQGNPQNVWTYQSNPDRVWRTWRNNQIFIRPKNGLYKNWNYGQNIPIASSGNQIYPYSQPCSCGSHGY